MSRKPHHGISLHRTPHSGTPSILERDISSSCHSGWREVVWIVLQDVIYDRASGAECMDTARLIDPVEMYQITDPTIGH